MFTCTSCEKESRTIQGLAAHTRNAHQRLPTPTERIPTDVVEALPEKEEKPKPKRRKAKVMPSAESEGMKVEAPPTVTYNVERNNNPTLNYCPNCGCCLKGVKESL